MAVIVAVLKPANHRSRRADAYGQLSLGKPGFDADLMNQLRDFQLLTERVPQLIVVGAGGGCRRFSIVRALVIFVFFP